MPARLVTRATPKKRPLLEPNFYLFDFFSVTVDCGGSNIMTEIRCV